MRSKAVFVGFAVLGALMPVLAQAREYPAQARAAAANPTGLVGGPA